MTTSIVLSSLLAVTFSMKCWKSLVCPRLCLHCLFFFYSFPVQACVKEATQMLPHLPPFDICSLVFVFLFEFVFIFIFVFVFYFSLYLCVVFVFVFVFAFVSQKPHKCHLICISLWSLWYLLSSWLTMD